jgi:hypothetical protein
MNTVELEDALDSYNQTKKNCQPHEYANWVIAIDKALEGDESLLKNFPPYVTEVYKAIKSQQTVSFSDDTN